MAGAINLLSNGGFLSRNPRVCSALRGLLFIPTWKIHAGRLQARGRVGAGIYPPMPRVLRSLSPKGSIQAVRLSYILILIRSEKRPAYCCPGHESLGRGKSAFYRKVSRRG